MKQAPVFHVLLGRAAFVRALRCLRATAAALLLAVGDFPVRAESPGVGQRFDSLTVGTRHYENVVVRGVSARSISITHAGGLASIPLRELPPELQARFGYDPQAERAADENLAAARRRTQDRLARLQESRGKTTEESGTGFERLLQGFGQPPVLRNEVDLRPRFRELSLWIKDQGRRPSCSIFAVVSALEFQNAELSGQPEKLSEEYLTWATRRATQRLGAKAPGEAADDSGNAASEDQDEGFTLPEVVAALRAYGIPPQAAMPNSLGLRMEDIPEPPAAVVAEARRHRRVFIHVIPGHDPATRLGNLIGALNEGVPVAIGLRWPHYRTLRSGYLSEQQPILGYAHAVTVVGYSCPSGRIEDAVFVFKNSWGTAWGEGGYGHVTYGYLDRNLLDGVVLEVQRPEKAD